MDIQMIINNQGTINEVTQLCEGEIKLESQRRGSPAKLTCNILRHGNINFAEGNAIQFSVNGVGMFLGYIFKKSRTKEQIISVTAYDQLRYLKNKDTYVYTQKTASEVLQMVVGDYGLALGSVADTGYVIPNRSEDIQTLMDIIYNAMDLTVINTGELFVLYDDFGRLSLKNIRDLKLSKLISAKREMIDFNYDTDIDTDSYNKIKLVKDNKNSGRREAYIAQDSGNMKKWGILQLTEKVDENMTDGQITARVNQLLKNHNRVNKSLTVENLTGDLNTRAGCSVVVEIPNLAEINLLQWMIIEKCVHTFKNNEHIMKLDLVGEIR